MRVSIVSQPGAAGWLHSSVCQCIGDEDRGSVPKRHAVVAHGHEDGIGAGPADGVELLQQELDELGFLLLVDGGQAVDDDKGVVTLIELDLIFLAEIRDVDLIDIEILVVEVLIAEVVEGRRHAGQSSSKSENRSVGESEQRGS